MQDIVAPYQGGSECIKQFDWKEVGINSIQPFT